MCGLSILCQICAVSIGQSSLTTSLLLQVKAAPEEKNALSSLLSKNFVFQFHHMFNSGPNSSKDWESNPLDKALSSFIQTFCELNNDLTSELSVIHAK